MVFSSVLFLFLFLPATILLYLPFKQNKVLRNVVLLAVSLVFYFWGERAYTAVMLLYIIVNYFAAQTIQYLGNKQGKQVAAKRAMAIAIIFDLGVLVFYKYQNFLLANLLPIFGYEAVAQNLAPVHLPIGISFFAFQAISYVIDVYRGDVPASKSLLNFAMYKAFFPQLIAGPIVRYRDVSKQVLRHEMKLSSFAHGFSRFCVGLGKKVLIANVLGKTADDIFQIPSEHLTSPIAWLGITCYTLQIYFDFSGYSDMAIGIARMFGFRFLENFNYPYIANSIRDFWRRWHISLSSWFRDYLYIPLGGNRCSPFRNSLNLLLVFFLCGLWHGANWTFVIWGMWHGTFLVLERSPLGRYIDRLWSPLRHAYVLLVVFIGWVFFRSDNTGAAINFLTAMCGFSQGNGIIYSLASYLDREVFFTLCLGVLFSLPSIKLFYRYWVYSIKFLANFSTCRMGRGLIFHDSGRMFACFILLFLSAISLASSTHNPFIYFRF